MSLSIPEWANKINAYLWLAFMGLLLSAISIIHTDKYIFLWLLTFIYGIFGFANNIGLKKYPKIRAAFSIILLILFATVFIFLSIQITEIWRYIA